MPPSSGVGDGNLSELRGSLRSDVKHTQDIAGDRRTEAGSRLRNESQERPVRSREAAMARHKTSARDWELEASDTAAICTTPASQLYVIHPCTVCNTRARARARARACLLN